MATGVAELVLEGRTSEAARKLLEYWGGPRAYDGLNDTARVRQDVLVRKVPLDFAALLSAPREPGWYGGIAAPTLLMMGRASHESVRTIAKTLWAFIPRSRLVELAGDHLMPLADPAPVVDQVVRFVESVPLHPTSRATGSGTIGTAGSRRANRARRAAT